MNKQPLTSEELEEIRRDKISSYIRAAEEQLNEDIDKMRHASIFGEYSEYNEVTHRVEKTKVDKDMLKGKKKD